MKDIQGFYKSSEKGCEFKMDSCERLCFYWYCTNVYGLNMWTWHDNRKGDSGKS